MWPTDILFLYALVVGSSYSLIKNKTETAVINIMSFRIFMEWTFRILIQHTFSKVRLKYDETYYIQKL